ncbi:MAG: DUF4197 domain-containing protein [Bacteroidia bacterium]|nr:DUF4197 domain-containing protein [Bacteroidia bacterium]
MKKIHFLFVAVMVTLFFSCETLNQVAKTVTTPTATGPTITEIISGLKQALEIGTNNSTKMLSAPDGYFKDPLVKIPFPPDAQKVANTLNDIGAGALVDEFVKLMNRGAEDAASQAGPIFVNAIKGMTIDDAKGILFGADNAATEYFKGKTRPQLYDLFYPRIKSSLDKIGATKAWTDVTTRYNKIPLVTPVNTDVTSFATNKGLDGLFLKIQGEEAKIRKDPVARVSDLLKKVFGELDKK